MHVLLIETSGMLGAVALADELALRAVVSLSTARKHARDLVPSIQQLYQQLEWTPAQTDWIVVDVGPGSYTGLRVGLTTAKTLAYVANARVASVDTMRVMAQSIPEDALHASVIVDAQQGQVYYSLFERSDNFKSPAIHIAPAEQWASELQPGTFVTGPALDRFEKLVPAHCQLAPPEQRQPSVEMLWKACQAQLQAETSDDLWSLEPLYLRASSAEIKWDRRQQPADSRRTGD